MVYSFLERRGEERSCRQSGGIFGVLDERLSVFEALAWREAAVREATSSPSSTNYLAEDGQSRATATCLNVWTAALLKVRLRHVSTFGLRHVTTLHLRHVSTFGLRHVATLYSLRVSPLVSASRANVWRLTRRDVCDATERHSLCVARTRRLLDI